MKNLSETNENYSFNNQFQMPEEICLNEEQMLAQELVLSGQNIFITGDAGTGKSFLLKHLIKILQDKYGKKQVGITSTTGTGAIIIGGNTIHSYLGIGVLGHLSSVFLLTKILSCVRSQENWQKTKVLIIDEISMLDGQLFSKLEYLARTIRKNDQPFGGIQLVLVGDFCQLPPAGKLIATYCFEVEAWTRCISKTINLTKIYRQKKTWFTRYLQMIRFGRLPKNYWEDMLKRLDREPDWPKDGIKPITLFSKNQEVNKLNEEELAELPGNSFFFYSQDKENISGKLKDLVKNCLSPEVLELKVGAQVMLIKNWYEENLFNGSQGIVINFTKENYPVVKFTNGKELVIKKHIWEKIEGHDIQNKTIISATRIQIPLILSWAITIHKCQGRGIERLKIDLNGCFMGGQVYTALSRAIDPDYLQIINFSYQKLWCEQKVKRFYHYLTTGKETKLYEKKINWHKKYLKDKTRKKYKEFAAVHQQTKEWPYENIKEFLSDQSNEYFKAFSEAVEKSISNSQNLIACRELLKFLKKWWKDNINILEKNTSK